MTPLRGLLGSGRGAKTPARRPANRRQAVDSDSSGEEEGGDKGSEGEEGEEEEQPAKENANTPRWVMSFLNSAPFV